MKIKLKSRLSESRDARSLLSIRTRNKNKSKFLSHPTPPEQHKKKPQDFTSFSSCFCVHQNIKKVFSSSSFSFYLL